jgi:hypothetical protein
MIQRGRGVRLLLEAPQAISVSGEGRGQHLDRDIASKTGIARAIDLSHAPPAPRGAMISYGPCPRPREER